jgi:hypothetical protein
MSQAQKPFQEQAAGCSSKQTDWNPHPMQLCGQQAQQLTQQEKKG